MNPSRSLYLYDFLGYMNGREVEYVYNTFAIYVMQCGCIVIDADSKFMPYIFSRDFPWPADRPAR